MNDFVTSPAHYMHGGVETKDLIAKMMTGVLILAPIVYFWWGNAFKYAVRWQWKGGVTDLKKCAQCVRYMIEELPDSKIMYNGAYIERGEYPEETVADIVNEAGELSVFQRELWDALLYSLWFWHVGSEPKKRLEEVAALVDDLVEDYEKWCLTSEH